MVTGNEEIKYGYLLDPCFQIVNTGGRPLTQGWIEVYIAGTRNKYYCSSDFAGTLHPFKIPLDSLGSNIILADVEKSYDVYVYNKFGNLAMSRYNITPGKGGAGGSVSGSGTAEHWIGKNGQNTSVPAGSDTALKLPTSYEYEGSFIDRINENRTAFYLREGLYLVQAVVNFKQSDQSLTNEIRQVDVFTRSDDAPEDMSFNRDMAGPDSSDDSHCLKVSFIRCVKEDDEVSQIVLFKVNTPNAWSECYLQNVQIARLSPGGTVGPTYSAGDYISIENDTISVTGIEPENYATHDELHSATSAFITSADLPDLSSYATEQWVLDKHYITSADIPDIPDDVVTSGELAQTSGLIEKDISDLTSSISEALADKMDKSSSADFYPRHGNPEGYLTSVPSEYVTESEMNSYVTEHTSGFITSADIPDIPDDVVTSAELATVSGEIVNQIPSLQGYATESYVTEHTSAFLTSADLPDVSDMATKTWVGEQGYLTSVPSEYITETELESAISGKADTSAIPDVSNFVTQEDIDAAVSGKMDATESSAFYPMASNPSGYLVGTDLNGYATEQYVQDETSAFLTPADLPSTEEVQFEELDLSGYATESYVDSAVSGKQDTLTFGYDESDKINAINGSAIAGGGGGGHEYSGANGVYVDNVNEVIGLDTSASNAIETVIENSGAWGGAGLPISAGPGIKIALENGVLMISNDETVLYDGPVISSDDNTVVALSGNPTDYSRIGLFGFDSRRRHNQYCELDPSYSGTISTFEPYPNGDTLIFTVDTLSFSGTNQVTFVSQRDWDSSGPYAGGMRVYKIVGIGRKSN